MKQLQRILMTLSLLSIVSGLEAAGVESSCWVVRRLLAPQSGERYLTARMSPNGKILGIVVSSGRRIHLKLFDSEIRPPSITRAWELADDPGYGSDFSRLLWTLDSKRVVVKAFVLSGPEREHVRTSWSVDVSADIAVVAGTADLGGEGVPDDSEYNSDGASLVFADGRTVMQRNLADSKSTVLVSSDDLPDGFFPKQIALSPSGHELALAHSEDEGIYVAQIGAKTRLKKVSSMGGNPLWSADGRYLLYTVTKEGRGTSIQAVSPASGRECCLLSVPSVIDGPLSISPDGSNIVFLVISLDFEQVQKDRAGASDPRASRSLLGFWDVLGEALDFFDKYLTTEIWEAQRADSGASCDSRCPAP